MSITAKIIASVVTTLMIASPVFAKAKAVRAKNYNKSAKSINVDQQLDGLGTNEEIIKKARALQPNNSMRVVQKREVDRNLRPEIGIAYGFVNGGDTYLNSVNWGANLDFHITPRWSLGLRYSDNRNELTTEGQRIFDVAAAKQAAGATDYVAPSIAFPIRTTMAVVNWYPIYGKVSWFESAVSQFDFYLIAGGGQIQYEYLNGPNEFIRGNSPIFTGGVGMGLWVNSWLTSRLEVRYQNYKDRVSSGERSIDGLVLQLGIGFML